MIQANLSQARELCGLIVSADVGRELRELNELTKPEVKALTRLVGSFVDDMAAAGVAGVDSALVRVGWSQQDSLHMYGAASCEERSGLTTCVSSVLAAGEPGVRGFLLERCKMVLLLLLQHKIPLGTRCCAGVVHVMTHGVRVMTCVAVELIRTAAGLCRRLGCAVRMLAYVWVLPCRVLPCRKC
jgi:hypothetical protein